MAGKWGVSLKKEDKVMDERRKAPSAGDEEIFPPFGDVMFGASPD